MIRYLLKFVFEKAYAEALLNGELFMRPACYYHKLEMGQGDIYEAALSHDMCVYKHSRVPVFCACAVNDREITDDSFAVSERCIKDFKCENGYVVILDFQKFEQALSTLLSSGYEVDGGLVNYHKLTFEDMGELIGDNTARNLFVKHPYFSYQKEFRIVVCREVYKLGDRPVDSIIYRFPRDLTGIAVCKEVAEFKQDAHYLFHVPDFNKCLNAF